jgi:hypothetical protein
MDVVSGIGMDPLIEIPAQGFDADSISQNNETHEEKPTFTPGDNQSRRTKNRGQSETR